MSTQTPASLRSGSTHSLKLHPTLADGLAPNFQTSSPDAGLHCLRSYGGWADDNVPWAFIMYHIFRIGFSNVQYLMRGEALHYVVPRLQLVIIVLMRFTHFLISTQRMCLVTGIPRSMTHCT
ncbi:hypothetical protein M758_3G015200 [Ceratodon purpureus]|nr:hypothetical protein M758_3G015200 [Ceratodon purpureus]